MGAWSNHEIAKGDSMADPHKPGPVTIERCVSAYQRLQHALAADDELAADEAPLAAMYAADPNILSPDELLRRFVAAIAFAEARAAEAKAFATGMAQRGQRYASRAAAMRTELLEVMLALERSSFSGSPFGTASVRKGLASPVVLDEDRIPDEYFVTRRALDRRHLSDDLKQGVVIEGAALSNPMPVLAIRYARATPTVEEADERPEG
jgi:Siphovirus Gp157